MHQITTLLIPATSISTSAPQPTPLSDNPLRPVAVPHREGGCKWEGKGGWVGTRGGCGHEREGVGVGAGAGARGRARVCEGGEEGAQEGGRVRGRV